MERRIAFLAIAVVLIATLGVSGCNQKPNNITAVKIYDEEYHFNTNLIESLKIKAVGEDGIKNLFDNSEKVCIVFQDSEKDNSYFAVISYNIVFKLTRYYTLFGKNITFGICDAKNISSDASIELRGPNTGANENSIILAENSVIVQGITYNELAKAGDKLILTVFGIKKLV